MYSRIYNFMIVISVVFFALSTSDALASKRAFKDLQEENFQAGERTLTKGAILAVPAFVLIKFDFIDQSNDFDNSTHETTPPSLDSWPTHQRRDKVALPEIPEMLKILKARKLLSKGKLAPHRPQMLTLLYSYLKEGQYAKSRDQAYCSVIYRKFIAEYKMKFKKNFEDVKYTAFYNELRSMYNFIKENYDFTEDNHEF